MPLKGWNHTWYITNALDYWPGGGGGGRVGVPVLGGKAGGTSEPAGEFSSWNRFLLSMPNWSAPFDWKTILDTEFSPILTALHLYMCTKKSLKTEVMYNMREKQRPQTWRTTQGPRQHGACCTGLLAPTLTQLMLQTVDLPIFNKTGGIKRTISPTEWSERKSFWLDIFMESVSLKTNVWVTVIQQVPLPEH